MSSWVDGATLLVCAPQVTSRRIENLTVLYHEPTDSVSQLDAVGSAIWLLLEEPIALADLSSELAAMFDVPPSIVINDMAALLDTLLCDGFIAVVD